MTHHEFMADLGRKLMLGLNIPTTLIACDSVGTAASALQELRAATERATGVLQDFGRRLHNRFGAEIIRQYFQKAEGLKYCGLTRKQRRKRIRIDRKHGRATTFLYAGKGFSAKVVFLKIRYPDPPTPIDFTFRKKGFPHDDLLDAVRGAMVMCQP